MLLSICVVVSSVVVVVVVSGDVVAVVSWPQLSLPGIKHVSFYFEHKSEQSLHRDVLFTVYLFGQFVAPPNVLKNPPSPQQNPPSPQLNPPSPQEHPSGFQ